MLHYTAALPLCFLLVSSLFSGAVFAQNGWWQTLLSNTPLVDVRQMLEKGGSWYECDTGEQGTMLCLDDFHYYQQHLYGELTLTQESAQFSFLVDYQTQNLIELILSLRKDGFVMNYIEIENERYDAVAALQEKTEQLVDKEIILLIHRYPQDATRRIDWVLAEEFNSPAPRVKGQLRSDGEMIELKIIRF